MTIPKCFGPYVITLGASLLRDLLSEKLSSKGVIRAGEGTIRAGYGSKRSSLKKFDSYAVVVYGGLWHKRGRAFLNF